MGHRPAISGSCYRPGGYSDIVLQIRSGGPEIHETRQMPVWIVREAHRRGLGNIKLFVVWQSEGRRFVFGGYGSGQRHRLAWTCGI